MVARPSSSLIRLDLGLRSSQEIVDALGRVVGREVSQEALLRALHSLGFLEGSLTPGQVQQVLKHLSYEPGSLGATARLALARFLSDGVIDTSDSSRMERNAGENVVSLLAATLGREKSVQLVSEVMGSLGLSGVELPKEQAIAVLNAIAKRDGLVGITARFAMAKVMLMKS